MDSQRDAPVYNIKAVSRLTGVPADTLRRWESRYNVIVPQRTESGYRLYSRRDVEIITWLKSRLAEGLSISSAFEMLRQMGGDPGELSVSPVSAPPVSPLNPRPPVDSPDRRSALQPVPEHSAPGVRSYAAFQAELFAALSAVDEARAAELAGEALSLYSVESVCINIFQPMLVQVGEAWASGEVSIAVEHFASSFVRARLENLFHSSRHNLHGPFVLLGCAPDELHELGAMFLALFLRRAGYKVVYLGQNVPLDSLIGMVQALHPDVVCVSATRAETAASLYKLRDYLDNMQAKDGAAPLLAYGGRVFNLFPHISERLGGLYLGEDALVAVRMLGERLSSDRTEGQRSDG